MNIIDNANELAERYERRRSRWDAGLKRGLNKIANLVLRYQQENLRGGHSDPGSFPIPAPTGNLLRSADKDVGERQALVFNSAEYAMAIHEGGEHAYGNPFAPVQQPRPFLQRAADKVDAGEIMHEELVLAIQ